MQYALVFVWLLVFAGLAVLGYPLAARLFSGFRSHGAGFALPVALVTCWLPVYWLGKLHYGPGTVAVGLLVLVGVAAGLRLNLDALRERRVEPASPLPINRRAVAEVAVVFAVAFGFLVAIRAVDPAVHALGGEKYLDFGMLNAILRAETLPPEDLWFAGEPVQYYYGGHLVAAILTTLTGTAPRFAYNLALAGFYAMLVTAAYDLASSIAAERGNDPLLAGAFGGFFVGFASNLDTAGRVLLGLLPTGLRESLVGPDLTTYTLGGERFHYWGASRIISDTVDGRTTPTINEFPLFGWLNGDLHAHMMGTPFLLLAAAIGFALYQTPASERRRRLSLLAVVPLLGLFQVVTDTWSFPSVFGVTYLALAFAPADPTALLPESVRERVRGVTAAAADAFDAEGDDSGRHALDELERLLVPLGVVAGLGAVTMVLSVPFLTGTGGERSIDLLPAAARSSLGSLLVVHGGFVAVFGLHLFARVSDERRWPLGLAVVALGAVATTLPLDILAISVPLLVVGWAVLRFDRPAGYETVLIVAGAGLVTIVELVFVNEQAGPLRMNTVFKTYMQVWVLWGTAAGAALVGLLERARAADPPSIEGVSIPSREVAATVFVVALVLSTSVYGVFALSAHFEGSPEPTLDATSFGPRYDDAEVAATDWLNEEATEETVIVSAPATGFYPAKGSGGHEPGMYNWKSSIAASLTGVPTVVGWAHEVGYRGSDDYYARVAAVDALYTGSSADAAAVIREHDVEYVWVGTAEQVRYRGDLVDFEERAGYEVAFENDAVTVYRVDESELPE
jgi:YYY domain-containing protein